VGSARAAALLIERDAGDGVVRPVIVDLGGRPDVVIETEISDNGAASSGHPTGRRSSPSGGCRQPAAAAGAVGRSDGLGHAGELAVVTMPAWQRLAP
jgi:hypothetical protein